MIRPMLAAFVTSLWAVLAAVPVAAQPVIEGAVPHAMVPLPAEGVITRDQYTDFAILEFPASPADRRGEVETMLTLEGAHRQLEYTVEGLELSLLRLYRGYLQHFESIGAEIVFSGIGEELGLRDGFTFISQAADFLSRTPSTASDSNAYILARSADEQTVVAVSFFIRQNARRIMVNALEIEEMEALDLFAPAPEPEAVPEPEAEPEPETELVPQAVDELEAGLLQDGRVIVTAILFEFDRAEILPESADALATVAELMEANHALRLFVVGHTDGVGSFDYNLRLSVERAQSVVAWLGERHGIGTDRLRAAGAGPMSPVTTNRTEDGRAQNRRVELVELID